MSISSELASLAANKAAIKAAIEAKNPEVAPTNDLAQWPTAIDSIPSGGGLQGYTLTINAIFGGSGPLCYAFALSDGRIVGIDTYNQLYFDRQIILNDVVSYVGFKIYGAEATPSTPVVLTGNTTVAFAASCLLAGTLITLANGTQKKIEDIKFDDELLVWDFDNGCLSTSKPLWIKKAQTVDYMYEIKFASGNSINVTGPKGHRAFNIDESTFTYLNDSVGQKVKTVDGEDEVVSCEKKNGNFDFYNIITDRHFNMFANGILTSCRLNNYRKIDGMKFAELPKVCHQREDFKDIPACYVDGLRLCEQPIDLKELLRYVANLIHNRHRRNVNGRRNHIRPNHFSQLG